MWFSLTPRIDNVFGKAASQDKVYLVDTNPHSLRPKEIEGLAGLILCSPCAPPEARC